MDSEKTKAVFLDRDGVIITEKDFIVDPEQLEFIPGSVEALKLMPSEYLKIIVSNQSGIGRGYFSYDQVENFNEVLTGKLKTVLTSSFAMHKIPDPQLPYLYIFQSWLRLFACLSPPCSPIYPARHFQYSRE